MGDPAVKLAVSRSASPPARGGGEHSSDGQGRLVEELLGCREPELTTRVRQLPRESLEAAAQGLFLELKRSQLRLDHSREDVAESGSGGRKVLGGHGGDLEIEAAAVLANPEDGRGRPASSSRQQESEEKVQQIYERLYNSGREHNIRRRVYSELGKMAEDVRFAETCTFEPTPSASKLPATVRGRSPGSEPIGERLFREDVERRRRLEELQAQVPQPPFRPSIAAPPDMIKSASQGAVSDRLFKEHATRKERQNLRAESEAEWKKHSFRPNIRKSQASGPEVGRG